MSTNQSGEKEGGEYVTTQVCNATKEELLRGEKYQVWDDCPACLKAHRVLCLVADHRSNQSTGNEIKIDDALNLFLYMSHLMSPSRSLL